MNLLVPLMSVFGALVFFTLFCINGWVSRLVSAADRRTDVMILNRREIENEARRNAIEARRFAA
jgi:hypothetical protein